jgi:hypothetical protein
MNVWVKRLAAGSVAAGLLLVGRAWGVADEKAAAADKVFELRTYHCNEGKLEDLHKRFRDHTVKLFEKHGIQNVGYWTPTEGDAAKDTLIYIVAHPSREAAKANFAKFGADPEWQEAYKESHKNGPLVKKMESVFMKPTDYSKIK